MGHIEFIDLREELQKNRIEWDMPVCCDPDAGNYSLLRVQMQQKHMSFSQKGVWIEDTEHDDKCRALLQLASEQNYDLVLFPEYCISYALLDEIIKNKHLWPSNRKLWVLPCQGIPIPQYEEYLNRFSANNEVFLLKKAWETRNVNKRTFVNVLFYCFLGFRDNNDSVLCLVPQLKTQVMGDAGCVCEPSGMSTGSVVFTLENRLLTLLCADSMNPEITWRELQNKKLLMSGLTILHPQLNARPKDTVFSRLRWELFEHGEPGAYITCNWAKGTELYQEENTEKPAKTIDISWSCIYRKHSGDILAKWGEKDWLRQENGKHGLFGAIMPTQQTEVWFSLYSEEAMHLIIPMLAYQGYEKVHTANIFAKERFHYDPGAKAWAAHTMPTKTLQQRIDELCSEEELLHRYSKHVAEPYRFPLDSSEKLSVDKFFALTLAEFHNNILEMDDRENLVSWTLLLDESEWTAATNALDRLLRLAGVFRKDLPPHCAPLREEPEFCYQPAQNCKPSINFQSKEQSALVAYALSAVDAQRHVKFLMKSECYNDEDLARQFVRVFFYDPTDEKLTCEPKLSVSIINGNSIKMKGDITNGGDESDS